MKKIWPWVLFSLFLLLGVGLLAYPTVSDYVNRMNGSHAIQVLADTLSLTDEAALEYQRDLAQAYNRRLLDPKAGNAGNYGDILDFGNGVMGYLEIPGIDVFLPVYHGTEEEILARGVGHMPQSAFPIGGEGNHAALVGHTGLPSARMLDDLVKLKVNDGFSVTVLGETLAYCVDQILVVEPGDSAGLAPVPGEDYCTLVTCTPYGVNSHRLLVRGRRVEKVQQTIGPAAVPSVSVEGIWWFAMISPLVMGIAVAAALILRLRRR